jgi:tetratricopeptide (TPR) repeat protein
MAIAHTNLGILYYTRGMWARAIMSFEQAVVLRRENGYLPEQALNLHNLGMLRMAMGDHTRARHDLEASLALSQRLGDAFVEVSAEIGLLQLAVVQSRFEDAAAHATRAERLLAAAGDEEAIQVRWSLALVYAGRGDLAGGLECAAQALEMARASSHPEQERECLRVLGALSARAGDQAQAERLLRESIALCCEQHDAYRQGLALLELGRAHELQEPAGAPGLAARALECYTSAAELFEQLGAAYDLNIAREACDRTRARQAQRPHSLRRGQTLICINLPREAEVSMIRR